VLLGTEDVKKDGSNYQEVKSLNDLAHAELCFGIIEKCRAKGSQMVMLHLPGQI
jgi:hypothetical protein